MTGGLEALGSIVALMERVLAGVFGAASWWSWRTLFHALDVGLETLTPEERAHVQHITGRTRLPKDLRELWLIVGRRAGKSIIAALYAVWAVTCRTYALAPGEVGVFMVIAADRRQARIVKRYIAGLLRAASVLEELIKRETADALWLTSGLVIEIHTCSFRSIRGYTVVGYVCDEVAFWQDEASSNPDREVLVALRAATATVPSALGMVLTTPYARRGEAWRVYSNHFGRDDSDRILVVNADTRTMNPTVDQSVIDAAYEDDPAAAAAEYGGEWRRDVETFLPLESIEAVVVPGRLELGPIEIVDARGGFDGAGGTGGDSATAAVAGVIQRGDKTTAALAAVREVRPPFSPEVVVAEFAAFFRSYGITSIVSDRYAGAWPVEAFAKHGITVVPSELSKSDVYRELLPMVMSGDVELLDSPRLKKQLGDLERRTARGGRDSIDHPPTKTAHDDVANGAALALVQVGGFASAGGGYFGFAREEAARLRAAREAEIR